MNRSAVNEQLSHLPYLVTLAVIWVTGGNHIGLSSVCI